VVDEKDTHSGEGSTKVEAKPFLSPDERKARSGEKVVFPMPQNEQLAAKHAERARRMAKRDDYEE